MDDRYVIADQNGMSHEFVDWFFDKKKSGCGNVWFMMMAAMWEGWQGHTDMQTEPVTAATVPDGWKLVPLELLESLRGAAHFEKSSYAASFGSHIDTGRWKDEFEELESVCKAVDKLLAAPEQEV